MDKRVEERHAKWRELIAEQQGSGQSITAFCRERGICAPSFFAWKKRLSETAAGKFIAVHVVEAKTPAPARPIEIRLSDGCRVMVEPGFEADHLRAVIAALEPRQ